MKIALFNETTYVLVFIFDSTFKIDDCFHKRK